MPAFTVDDLIRWNMEKAGIDPTLAIGAHIPIFTPRRRLGNYACKLGDASVSSLAAAITQAETGGNIKYNNPGNLEMGNAGGLGTWSPDGVQQITIFPTLAAGEAALQAQIQKIISGSGSYPPNATIAQVADIYVSGQPNSGKGANWAQNVANFLGVSPQDSFAAQAGAAGGSLVPAGGGSILEADAAAVNDAIDQATGYEPPAWLPYVLGAIGIYFVWDAVF